MDDRLQCMPYGISPMVIFYNKALVDFDRMEARGPRRSRRGAARLDLRPVRRGGRLRDPPAQGHPRGVRRADAGGAGPVHLLRRWTDVRRRDGPHVARVLRQHHPGRSGADARAAAQPHPDPQRGAARAAHPARVVRARPARDDGGHPRPGPRAAAGAGPRLRRHRHAGAGAGRHRRGRHRPVHVEGRRQRSGGRRLHGAPARHARQCARRPGRLPRPGEPRGGPVRRLPPAGSAAGPRRRVQHQRPQHRASRRCCPTGRSWRPPSQAPSTR